MQVHVYYENQLRFRARARGHQTWTDWPFAAGGQDSGMTPAEWFLSALGSCMGGVAVRYLEAQGIAPQGLQLSLQVDNPEASALVGQVISIHIILDVALDRQQRVHLREAVEACELSRLLQSPPRIVTEVLATSPKLP